MVAALAAGLIAGLVHVFTGPDHLAALTPLALRARRSAWIVGFRWGLGHSAGVLAVASLAVAFRSALDLDVLSSWGERLVGASLVLLGLWGFRALSRDRLHAHPHPHAAFGVGVLHGLAGTAHLLGVLPTLALPTSGQAAAYLGAFAAGTVAAMTLFAAVVGRVAPARWALGAASAACTLTGAAWIVR